MLLLRRDKHHVTLIFTLVIISATLGNSLGVNASSQLQTINNTSLRNNSESISARMLQIRQLLKSLFLDGNVGESEFKGALARTFGRIRMIRQIVLPLAFVGGFITAIILFIKATGIVNMLLISKVLLLQVALVIGKMVWGLKDLLFAKLNHQQKQPTLYPYPVYIQPDHGESSHHGSHYGPTYGPPASPYGSSYAYANSREDNRAPNMFNYQQTLERQPLFNQPMNYYQNVDQPQRNIPHTNYGQPQAGSFYSDSVQQTRFNNVRNSDNFESLDSRLNNENLWNDVPNAQQLIQQQPQNAFSSMSPLEMTKLLSDAIAKLGPKNNFGKRYG